MYSDQVHPCPVILLPLFLKTISTGSIVLFSYMHVKYFDYIHPTTPFPFTLSDPASNLSPGRACFIFLSFIVKDEIPHRRENMMLG
jgi:hypothetical protein